jgi:[acyl-carrier-protein] S-malonyltransferase
MKVGLLFAGQGAQYPGLGKSLHDCSDAAKRVFALAGKEIEDWCFEGTKEMLRQTDITQPCIYTVSMAAWEAFRERGGDAHRRLEIAGLAGFSMGEYAALTAAGSIGRFETGLNIVRRRGTWMSEAGKDAAGENKGGMVAAFGERTRVLDCVEASRDRDILEGVNFNSPIQTVVAGDKAALERFRQNARAMGLKAVPLSVGAAFHSPMMEPAVPKLRELLLASGLKRPAVKVYSNVTGKDVMDGAGEDAASWLAAVMAAQARSPVRWQETIESMVADGIRTFIELGPGNTLSVLAKKINNGLIAMNIEDRETLTKTVAALENLLAADETKEV